MSLMNKESSGKALPAAVKLVFHDFYEEEQVRKLEYEFIFAEKGSGKAYFDNVETDFNAGDIAFVDSFESRSLKSSLKGEALRCTCLSFDISALGNENDSCRRFFSSIAMCRFIKLPEGLVKRVFHTAQKTFVSGEKDLVLRSLLFDILSYVAETEQYEKISLIPETKTRTVSAIENARNYIKDNYSENISLSEILQLTNYSKSQFIRLFKNSTGMNFSEYINKFRIEKSCLDLIYSDKNITEIATTNGFNNIQYFSRKFKEYMNCTPKQYQKKRKKLTER